MDYRDAPTVTLRSRSYLVEPLKVVWVKNYSSLAVVNGEPAALLAAGDGEHLAALNFQMNVRVIPWNEIVVLGAGVGEISHPGQDRVPGDHFVAPLHPGAIHVENDDAQIRSAFGSQDDAGVWAAAIEPVVSSGYHLSRDG